jgi:ATP-dependent Lon protease
MTESILIREQLDRQKVRDEFAVLEKIHNVELEHAMLKTVFDASQRHAVSQDQLKALKREIEDHLRYSLGSVNDAITSANAHQAKDILAQVELMNARSVEQSSREAQSLRRSIMLAMLGTAFSVVGSILFLIMTGQR